MSRMLTIDELSERVNRAFEASALEAGLTVEQAWDKIARAWNEAIALDEREEAAGLWND